ncbi:chemotaxis protein CheW [Microvirga aerophila]|uniref:Chemotaxis protein CheW n=1 Tax=Microvirga aerophila TaxID=670291 RepID=A0A512BS84_9HYPH|nr:chemotaxis protein CheW [Microvirga aerophila]GEO14801.1 chemotaxis protein CheW [Microvirga aerophila]
MTETAPPAVDRSFLTIKVGDERFAVPASDVAEVIRPPSVTRVPLGPKSLVGVANLRGAVMPVVSLRALLGTEGEPPASPRVIVIDRGSPIGLMIDEVTALGAVDGVGDTDRPDDGAPARLINLDGLLARDFGSLVRRARQGQSSSPAGHEQETTAVDEEALVSFGVAGQDFALPLESVREVVALPTGIAAVPRTEAVMLGVMTLRGQLLPLVSLHGLLGLRGGSQSDARSRVVITHVGDEAVGLVTDGMKEILRVPSGMIDPVPAVLTRGAAEAEVQGICRLDGGRRLVSILSADRLFRDRSLAERIAPHTTESHDMGMKDMRADSDEQFIVFQLGGEEYGLPIGSVDEVVRVPETLTRLPKAPAFIDGVMNLRGRVVPVIDQRRRFDFEGRGERRRERVVVVTIDHLQAGFVVDGVSEVLKIPASQLRPTPEVGGDRSQVIDRIANIEIEGRMILLLDPRELLDKAEKDLLAAMNDGNTERPTS